MLAQFHCLYNKRCVDVVVWQHCCYYGGPVPKWAALGILMVGQFARGWGYDFRLTHSIWYPAVDMMVNSWHILLYITSSMCGWSVRQFGRPKRLAKFCPRCNGFLAHMRPGKKGRQKKCGRCPSPLRLRFDTAVLLCKSLSLHVVLVLTQSYALVVIGLAAWRCCCCCWWMSLFLHHSYYITPKTTLALKNNIMAFYKKRPGDY